MDIFQPTMIKEGQTYVHLVLVNHMGGLSLPRKSVTRLIDQLNLTLIGGLIKPQNDNKSESLLVRMFISSRTWLPGNLFCYVCGQLSSDQPAHLCCQIRTFSYTCMHVCLWILGFPEVSFSYSNLTGQIHRFISIFIGWRTYM